MKPRGILCTGVFGAMLALAASPAGAATKCDLSFHLEGWSVLYKTAHGGGRVTCDNGQVRRVAIRMTGGGVTVGRSELNGRGDFSPVGDIREVYGSYANAEAHAGLVRSSTAQVVTKGTVSLAFAGKGNGIDLGIEFGKLTITPVVAHHRH
jgi:hypothetical protein